jgi:hypothetical protein
VSRLIRVLSAAALVALPTVALAASSSSQVWVTNCTKEQYKPSTLVLACIDGYVYLTKLKWTAWTGSQATGSGTEVANDCKPNCVSGHFHGYPVSVVLSKPKTCHKQTHRVFDDLKVTFTGTRPASTAKTLKLALGCPY